MTTLIRANKKYRVDTINLRLNSIGSFSVRRYRKCDTEEYLHRAPIRTFYHSNSKPKIETKIFDLEKSMLTCFNLKIFQFFSRTIGTRSTQRIRLPTFYRVFPVIAWLISHKLHRPVPIQAFCLTEAGSWSWFSRFTWFAWSVWSDYSATAFSNFCANNRL